MAYLQDYYSQIRVLVVNPISHCKVELMARTAKEQYMHCSSQTLVDTAVVANNTDNVLSTPAIPTQGIAYVLQVANSHHFLNTISQQWFQEQHHLY
jgi:hypothetical protein